MQCAMYMLNEHVHMQVHTPEVKQQSVHECTCVHAYNGTFDVSVTHVHLSNYESH